MLSTNRRRYAYFSLAIVAMAASAGNMIRSPVTAARASEPSGARLIVRVTGLRSVNGNVVVALFRGPDGFPNKDDRAFANRVVGVAGAKDHTVALAFDGLKPGDYAISLFHDENSNGRLDTSLGIPREGFGVSNNPRLHWGPPTFKEAHFTIGATPPETTVSIALRYLAHGLNRVNTVD